jgi:hypothetical protein
MLVGVVDAAAGGGGAGCCPDGPLPRHRTSAPGSDART